MCTYCGNVYKILRSLNSFCPGYRPGPIKVEIVVISVPDIVQLNRKVLIIFFSRRWALITPAEALILSACVSNFRICDS